MRVHALPGLRGRIALLVPGPWAEPLPIHRWLIEHDEHRILVDTGETAAAKDLPFARHLVARAQKAAPTLLADVSDDSQPQRRDMLIRDDVGGDRPH